MIQALRHVEPPKMPTAQVVLAALGVFTGVVGVFAGQPLLTPAATVECLEYAASPSQVGTTPPLVQPMDIAIDGAGDVFVVDSLRADLIRIDADTRASNILLGKPWLEIPVGLTISPTHADLYVGDENTSTIWHIPCQTRNNNSCQLYHKTPLNISLSHQVHPFGLQIDAEEHLFIADKNGHRVLKRNAITGHTDILMSAETTGTSKSSPFSPQDITLDPESLALMVTDVANDEIWILPCKKPSPKGYACDQYVRHF